MALSAWILTKVDKKLKTKESVDSIKERAGTGPYSPIVESHHSNFIPTAVMIVYMCIQLAEVLHCKNT